MHEPPLILITDDEAVNRLVLKRVMSEAGFGAATANNGLQARELARQLRPDLIILDIMMPGESGLETCKALQSDPVTRDIPIIFLSGLSAVTDKLTGLETGAVDYVTKPFSGEEVLARVRIHLRLRRARQALISEQAAKLSLIREAQRSLLVSPSDEPEARFAVRFITRHEAGGDIYDVFSPSPDSHAYFVADVTGHDLGASFFTPAVKSLIRQNASPLYSPGEAFATMNGVLRQVLSPGQLLTAAYLLLNRTSGKARLVRAGHPEPVLVRRDARAEMLAPEGDVLGCFESAYHETHGFRMTPGDRVYLYTDGLLERPDRSLAQGQIDLLAACERARDLPREAAVETILAELAPETDALEDDVVLLAVDV